MKNTCFVAFLQFCISWKTEICRTFITQAMNKEYIYVQNAHANNLKNISVEIPKHKLVVFTGVSGSGKSSLLFDTIYTEAQRQLVETFPTFARARMPKLSRPDVDDILNLSTAIVINQKRMGNNLRSTVGTATEINTYLRLLYSRLGNPFSRSVVLFLVQPSRRDVPALSRTWETGKD